MDKNRDWSISRIRFCSMLFIITCHFMQYFNCELAWWFNVGVQVFLCISGYLYGSKDHINTMSFLKKNYIKILVGFYIVSVSFSIIHFFFLKTITIKDFIKILLLGKTLNGGAHLWFIPTILCCYFLTPFLNCYFGRSSSKKLFLKLAFLLFLTLFLFKIIIPFFNPAWISCYLLGFYFARIRLIDIQCYKNMSVLVIFGALVSNTMQVIYQYILNKTLPTTFCDYSHMLLGVGLFVIFRKVFNKAKENRILDFSDKYSYSIFLVHQFLILGPLSLMKLTQYTVMNILIIIIFILALGILLKMITVIAEKALDRFIKYLNNKIDGVH